MTTQSEDREDGPPAGVGATDVLSLRVSVAALVRVVFESPDDGRTLLALERTATLRTGEGRREIAVVAKPFGGAVVVTDPEALRTAIGDFRFDSERSRRESDFRLQIRPSSWEAVKTVCRAHLREGGGGGILDPSPHRELAEEFADTLNVAIGRDAYRLRPWGMLAETAPRTTTNVRAPGRPTVRIYYVFEASLERPELIASLMESSSRTSDRELASMALRQAEQGGRGRANTALVVGLDELRGLYRALPRTLLDERQRIGGHWLADHVPVLLDDIDHPRYERFTGARP